MPQIKRAADILKVSWAGMATKAARLAAHVARERVTRPVARARGDVPASPAALTAEWLTAVLCSDVAGSEVTSFERLAGSEGTTNRCALRVEYNRRGRDAALPERLFAKFTSGLTSRLVLGLSGELPGESTFYNEVRPLVNLRAPIGYLGGYDERSGRSVVLLEDIDASQGAVFCIPTTSLTYEQATSLVSTLAALHGAMWQSDGLGRWLAVLDTPLERMAKGAALVDMRKRCEVGLDRSQHVMPSEFVARRHELWGALGRSLEVCGQGDQTFLHGDAHLGNFYLTGDEVGACDWQASTIGSWSFDVSYALTCALPVEDRRRWEGDLLRRYLGELGARGGVPPSFDAAWRAYRQQMFWGLHAWLATIGRSRLMPHMQPDEISLAELERVSNAIIDHDSLDSFPR